MSLDVLMLLYHPVLRLLTPQNLASLSYAFSFTFVFLVTLVISWLYRSQGYFFYISPGYVSNVFPKSVYSSPGYVSISSPGYESTLFPT